MSLVGKTLSDPAVPVPAAVIDRAAVKRNCARMIASVKALGVSWRAHIKTHKTTEITRLQVGDLPARLVVSTLREAEQILPLLLEFQAAGKEVNMLYGFPLYASAVPRLAAVARALGARGVSIIVDHPGQVPVAQQLASAAGTAVQMFVKIDMGTHRAGVILGTEHCTALLQAVHATTSGAEAGDLVFYGLYCHAGHSYDARAPWASMEHLLSEFTALSDAATAVQEVCGGGPAKLTLSVGATPTAATLQHPGLTDDGALATATTGKLRAVLASLRDRGYEMEVHAGVQPVLDLQQLATHSWAPVPGQAATEDIALTVLADVASIYPGGGARSAGDEVLVNVGCLGLSRDTVKEIDLGVPVYTGLGIAKPWSAVADQYAVPGDEFPRRPTTESAQGWWEVNRVSQEHGILTWSGPLPAPTPSLGQRLQLWTNHACITAACYTEFLVVDSDSATPDTIVDVWQRWNQW